ncbi:hypothetical protein HPB50_025256 [Hyalomma asiaticum]|uniref:Uncharacterized protein n=1 Tax=Hyalomma asiaticum TaxID=266040 RepID=A0ACB7SCB3_HYAAI|nr:hypothetical protein HPB50_025256 [Hyalomma asiaticum]
MSYTPTLKLSCRSFPILSAFRHAPLVYRGGCRFAPRSTASTPLPAVTCQDQRPARHSETLTPAPGSSTDDPGCDDGGRFGCQNDDHGDPGRL